MPRMRRRASGWECDNQVMIERRTMFDHDGITVTDVACRHRAGRGHGVESSSGHMIVFVRRGLFIRSADGVQTLLDPSVAYCMNPGEEHRYDHPHGDGDDCTAVALDPATVAGLWGDDHPLPSGALPMPSDIDLEHRMLLAAVRRAANPHALHEQAMALAADALEQRDPDRIASGRPATHRARRTLANESREALAADPDIPLSELSQRLAVSPHHLSRIFRSHTGHTIARHRMLLRARAGLERIAGGERDLTRLAADLGFADQSHLCRVIKALTGQTPSALRDALG